MEDIYPILGKNLLEIPIHKSRKCRETLREELIEYVKKEVIKGHYPTRRFIENKFKLRLYPGLFNSIEDLYTNAGICYKQENSQELKNKKAKLLTDIAISILPKLGLDILEVKNVYNKGVDIIAINYQEEIIGVEIKAHNKYEPIKKRNFLQLIRFLENGNLSKVILITTASRFENYLNIPNNLEIIDYDKLKKICTSSQLEQLNFIRNSSIHQETDERAIKKQCIINYAKKLIMKEEGITYNKILKNLNLDIYTYFNTLNDIYVEAGSLPPLNKLRGKGRKDFDKYYESIINEVLEYMKQEISKGYYPSGIDIGKKFRVGHIWNFITMTELYQRLEIEPYHKRRHRFKPITNISKNLDSKERALG